MHCTSRVVVVNSSSKLSLFDVLVAIAIAIAVVVAKIPWCLGSSSLPLSAPHPPPPAHLPEDPGRVVTYISVGYVKLLHSRVYPLVVFKA